MRALSRVAENCPGEEFITNIIEVFLADMSERVSAAGLLMSQDDGAGLAATAHALKGGCGHFGAVLLMQLCGAIEDQVRKQQPDGIHAAVNSMIAEAQRVRDALIAFRSKQAAL
jgi:HPt (histidine-containing phosphotransfer) domain-containing protein